MRLSRSAGDAGLAGAAAALALALVTTVGLAGTHLSGQAAAAVVQPADGATTGLLGHPAAVQRPARAARPSTAIDRDLQSRLAARMARATAGRYGLVVDIAGVGRVASIHPAWSLRPASTQKLFTTLPLLLNRSQDSLVTDVAVTAAPVAGVVTGDLVVRAADDPSLTKHDLGHLARLVRAAGIRRVTGRLRLDIASLPRNTRQPGWKPDFVPTDIGPLSPFPVHEDTLYRGSAYLVNPTAGNLQMFRNRLKASGVRVQGANEIVRHVASGQVVASHSSRPLAALVQHTLQVSDNFYAESLLAVLGGHAAVQSVSRDAGVTDTSSATDGSGLSYSDRETARGEVTLLAYGHNGPAVDQLVASLPVACRTGTLEHRMCHTIAAGKVFAKTGTLTHTTALSGFTTDGAGRLVTFSVICGQVRSITAAMNATDRVVLLLRRYSR